MDEVLEPIENALDQVGLMQGAAAPLKRTIVGGAIGYAVIATWKPAWAYAPDGTPYLWSVTNPNAKNTTKVPYWLAAMVPAFVLGVLI